MAAEFTLTRTVTNLSKDISTVKQHHEFMPYKLDDEISFKLTDSQYFSAKAVKRETDGMLFCANHPLCNPEEVHLPMNNIDTNHGGYAASELRNYLRSSSVVGLFPDLIRAEMLPLENGDWLRIPVFSELFGDYRSGKPRPGDRWRCMGNVNNRCLKRLGNHFDDIIPAPYWLSTPCGVDFPDAFYYVNREGEIGPCLASLDYCAIRLVFKLKHHR